jgi:hypothetical protein
MSQAVTTFRSSRSLRRAYREWIDEQIEEFKDTISRSELHNLADEVVEELRISRKGQYQLTELLLCAAVDRKIFRMLGLPGYKRWCAIHTPPPDGDDPQGVDSLLLRVE